MSQPLIVSDHLTDSKGTSPWTYGYHAELVAFLLAVIESEGEVPKAPQEENPWKFEP